MGEVLLIAAALIFALAVVAGEIHFALETRRFNRPRRSDVPRPDRTCGGYIGNLPGDAEDLTLEDSDV